MQIYLLSSKLASVEEVWTIEMLHIIFPQIDKTDAQASLERIQNFEEAFNRIQSATGIEDIEELVGSFHSSWRDWFLCFARFTPKGLTQKRTLDVGRQANNSAGGFGAVS